MLRGDVKGIKKNIPRS